MTLGDRIREARELRGLTQTELASQVQVHQSAISQYESDRSAPSPDILQFISLATGFPPAFFHSPWPEDFPLGSMLFRSLASMTTRQRSRAHRYAQLSFEIFQRLVSGTTFRPPELPEVENRPLVAAGFARTVLGLSPDTPVKHLVRSLESHGIIVLALPLELERGDAFSLWAGEPRRAVIVLSANRPGGRLRFSVAHELGHLIMHRTPRRDPKVLEREAHAFAGEFLVPSVAVRQDMQSRTTLSELSSLRPRWGVSIQALLRRLKDTNVVSERQYRSQMEQLSRMGWRKIEPGEEAMQPEAPRALRKLAELKYGVPIDVGRIAFDMTVTPAFMTELLTQYAERSPEEQPSLFSLN